MSKVNFGRILLIFIGVSGCFSVLLGAWLSHAGQHLHIEQLNRIKIALQYQMFHTIALLAVVIWYQQHYSKLLMATAVGFVVGIVCFSGSLYIKSFFLITQVTVIAPLGGMAFAIAWLLLIFKGFNNK